MHTRRRHFLSLQATRAALAAGVAALLAAPVVALSSPAAADTAPTDPADRPTVSADALPTVQINGVVWDQATIGNTVYVAGEFTQARPAGTPVGAAGSQTRSNLLAYDVRTGNLLNSWTPGVNGAVLSIEASPDGSRVYIGGTFTSVFPDPDRPTTGAVTLRRIAALDASTGAAVTSFNPNPDYTVRDIAATDSAVFLGGSFSVIGPSSARSTRPRAASVRASDGSALPWAPQVSGGYVTSVALSPDAGKVLLGGTFTSVNGSSNPGYGLAALDGSNAALLPWAANSTVRVAGQDPNSGNGSGVTSLTTAGNSVYATTFTFGSTGNFEGMVRMAWADGSINLMADCHGDLYDTVVNDDVTYAAGHTHNCSNLPNGWLESSPRQWDRTLAFSTDQRGVLRSNHIGGRFGSFEGTPAPKVLHWFPDVASGNFTGQSQGSWTMESANGYVVVGGEFPSVNGVAQQGLVRFGPRSAAPNSTDRKLLGSEAKPTLSSPASGQVLVTWQVDTDYDNELLTYRIIRNGDRANPVVTRQVSSLAHNNGTASVIDSGLTPGANVTYAVEVTDATGHRTTSPGTSIAVSGSGTLDGYTQTVMRDSPVRYWKFEETSGSGLRDSIGFEDATARSGVNLSTDGVASGSGAQFAGNDNSRANTTNSVLGPQNLTVEAWLRSDGTNGGALVDFSTQSSGNSGTNDRVLYLDSAGRVTFGARPQSGWNKIRGNANVVDGKWHHVVGTIDLGGMTLYVDGQQVAYRQDVRMGRVTSGYWRIGGDNLTNWEGTTSRNNFTGSLDEVAVYARALSAAEVAAHFAAVDSDPAPEPEPEPNVAPTAQVSVSTSGQDASFSSAGSADSDGTIASYAWDFGDGATSDQPNPTHTYAGAGPYQVRLTVTDDDGATGQATRSVSFATLTVGDDFERTTTQGWGEAAFGATWRHTGSLNRWSTNGDNGVVRLEAAGRGGWGYLPVDGDDNSEISVLLSSDVRATGGGIFASVAARASAAGAYRTEVRLLDDGRVRATLYKVINESKSSIAQQFLTGVTYQPGQQLAVKMRVEGDATTQIQAKVWPANAPEPSAWTVQALDSQGAVRTGEEIGLYGYLSGSANQAPVQVSFDDLEVTILD